MNNTEVYNVGYLIEKLENSLLMIRSEIERELKKENVNWESIKDLGNKSYDLKVRINQLTEIKLKLLLKKGADVSDFGDPLEWQKNEREDRKIE